MCTLLTHSPQRHSPQTRPLLFSVYSLLHTLIASRCQGVVTCQSCNGPYERHVISCSLSRALDPPTNREMMRAIVLVVVLHAAAAAQSDDPKKWDSDADGLTDVEEEKYGTNPWRWDTDGDGLGDGAEVRRY
mgnify:CR=1 FL=1